MRFEGGRPCGIGCSLGVRSAWTHDNGSWSNLGDNLVSEEGQVISHPWNPRQNIQGSLITGYESYDGVAIRSRRLKAVSNRPIMIVLPKTQGMRSLPSHAMYKDDAAVLNSIHTLVLYPPPSPLIPLFLALRYFLPSSIQNTELANAANTPKSRSPRPSVWKIRWRNGTYMTASWPNRLPPTARLNMRFPVRANSPRRILLPSLRQVKALNMSKKTKQVKVMVVSRAVTVLSDDISR